METARGRYGNSEPSWLEGKLSLAGVCLSWGTSVTGWGHPNSLHLFPSCTSLMFVLLPQQREFNSMQDRVMLLADSSEDEF